MVREVMHDLPQEIHVGVLHSLLLEEILNPERHAPTIPLRQPFFAQRHWARQVLDHKPHPLRRRVRQRQARMPTVAANIYDDGRTVRPSGRALVQLAPQRRPAQPVLSLHQHLRQGVEGARRALDAGRVCRQLGEERLVRTRFGASASTSAGPSIREGEAGASGLAGAAPARQRVERRAARGAAVLLGVEADEGREVRVPE